MQSTNGKQDSNSSKQRENRLTKDQGKAQKSDWKNPINPQLGLERDNHNRPQLQRKNASQRAQRANSKGHHLRFPVIESSPRKWIELWQLWSENPVSSGKRLQKYEKSTMWPMGTSTISMAFFNSYVSLPGTLYHEQIPAVKRLSPKIQSSTTFIGSEFAVIAWRCG